MYLSQKIMMLKEPQVHRSSIALIGHSGSNSNSVTHVVLISVSKRGGVSVWEYLYPAISWPHHIWFY